MSQIKILWVDDEIDLLKPHILFLEKKNYNVTTCNNGQDAIDLFDEQNFDIVFLDENMPGLSGLETLSELKEKKSSVPVIMITKSEEEYIMEEAIGSKIADYLIKPVNPNQILLSLKKNLDHSRLVSEKTTLDYQKEFRKIAMDMAMVRSYEDWVELYKKLLFWELELENIEDQSMVEILESQKAEANMQFGKFIERNYEDWFQPKADKPVLSHEIFGEFVAPEIRKKDKPILFIVIDNLRYDQWKAFESIVNNHYKLEKEVSYFSILPTATQYCRNAIFAGMLPVEIEKYFPLEWKNDDDEGGKNLHEETFMRAHLAKLKKDDLRVGYHKIVNHADAQQLLANMHNLLQNDLSVIVYNFVDMLSHARTEMEVLKELASDESSYRSLTKSWFEHSPLFQALKKIADKKIKIVLATDHGSVRVNTPNKIIGDKQTTANLRYKHGRNLDYDAKDVLAFKDPTKAGLPVPTVNSSYVFAKEDGFLCYPNNYNHFVGYYKNTFQHGGISLEEMIVPVIKMVPKGN